MRIDTHQHAFWHGRTATGLVADMDRLGIDRAWLLNWEVVSGEDPGPITEALNPVHIGARGEHPGLPFADQVRARDEYPARFLLGFCPHPLVDDACERFRAAHRMYGVRVCGEWKCRMLLDDPRCLELFRTAGRLGCPVVLHIDVPYLVNDKGTLQYQPLWYGGTVGNLQRAAEVCPDTVFVGHGPGFWREISAGADLEPGVYPQEPAVPGGRLEALLRNCPNVWADLSAGSGLNALRRLGDDCTSFLQRWSARLLFARDYYGGDLLQFLGNLDLSPETRAAIEFGNARRLEARAGEVGG
jgi:predicted TIM-barrel fold metal-dependent hydrolase